MTNPISGNYQGSNNSVELELRIDIDGTRTHVTNHISGDFLIKTSNETNYLSFLIANPTINHNNGQTAITGVGVFSQPEKQGSFNIVITTTPGRQPEAVVTLNNINTGITENYNCAFVSEAFRTVRYEHDYEAGITPFTEYNTRLLSETLPERIITLISAFDEAGIKFEPGGESNELLPAKARLNNNPAWSDSELHAAMEKHFSLGQNKTEAKWQIWLLAAHVHEPTSNMRGNEIYGIMFDQAGTLPRQGCAVFYSTIEAQENNGDQQWVKRKARRLLHTYIHELGHCFNLLHSFEKHTAVPTVTDRPAALSWMNYPHKYLLEFDDNNTRRDNEVAYWQKFNFSFDDEEIIHLRHAFRENIIMGGNQFKTGAALIAAPADTHTKDCRLSLELRAKEHFLYGEPVVVEIKLSRAGNQDCRVKRALHPKFKQVQIAIRKSNSNKVIIYRPLIGYLIDCEPITLNEEYPSIYESAYIGYGKDGFYFDEHGTYQLQAEYCGSDGSLLFSQILELKVLEPHGLDKTISAHFTEDQQGKLLYLLGSDTDSLKKGNDSFPYVINNYPDHPLTLYARLVLGINHGRNFKRLTTTESELNHKKSLDVRDADYQLACEHLSRVVDISLNGNGLDNITLNFVMRSLAKMYKADNRPDKARQTIEQMLVYFKNKNLKPHIMEQIEEEAKQYESD